MLDQRVDGNLVPVNQVVDARRQTGVVQQLGGASRRHRDLFGRLQYETVSARDGKGKHPHGNHRRKIERRDSGAHSERLSYGMAVDPLRHVFERITHHQAGHPAGDLDHLDRALHRHARVFESLAVFGGKNPRDLVRMLVEQGFVLVENLDAIDHGNVAPLEKRGVRGARHAVDLSRSRVGHLGDHVAGRGIRHRVKRAPRSLFPFPVYIKLQRADIGCDHTEGSFFIKTKYAAPATMNPTNQA